MKNLAKKQPDEVAMGPKVIGRGTKRGKRFDLKTLRVAMGLTQNELAIRSGMAQGDVSRLEAQEDARLSTLTRHAEALGGTLEVAVCINGRKYLLEL
jgi:DNA-binding Xre family transcriptional regulator